MALNHAVAVAMAHGAQVGLALLEAFRTDQRIADDHRFHAVRAHLLERVGDPTAARDAYIAAAQKTHNLRQQRYLYSRAARLDDST